MSRYFFESDARRLQLITEATSWIGTPFWHRQHVKGVGVDCVQFAGQVMMACGVLEAYDFGEYSLDWSMHQERSLLEEYLVRTARFLRLASSAPMVGDVACFKVGKTTHHCGIMIDGRRFVHALARAKVTIAFLDDSTWAKRLAALYRAIEL